jgi:hypothetical protein
MSSAIPKDYDRRVHALRIRLGLRGGPLRRGVETEGNHERHLLPKMLSLSKKILFLFLESRSNLL